MTLHALLSATETTENGGELRASQLVAGQYLLERQADMCRRAGARQIFVCVEMMSDDLVSAFDRLRSAGLSVEPVRRASEIVDRTHPRDQLLLMLDGLHATGEQIDAFAGTSGSAVFVTHDTPVTRGLERIDADHRWAGLAITGCDMLADLADMPDDWDLASTLLRRAVQRGATHVPCDPGLFERGELTIVDSEAATTALSERVYDSAAFGERGLVMANILAPLARFAGPALLRKGAREMILDVVAIAFLLAANIAWAVEWIATGAIAGIAGLMTLSFARYVGLFTLEPETPRWRSVLLEILPVLAFFVLAARILAQDDAAWMAASMVAIFALALIQAAHVDAGPGKWVVRLLPDAATGFAIYGLGAALGAFVPTAGAAALLAMLLLTATSLAGRAETATGFIPN